MIKFQASLLAAGVLLAACGESTTAPSSEQAEFVCTDPAPADGAVNVYSARHYDSDRVIFDQFTCETGIKVNLLEAESDQLIQRLRSEAEFSPADVLITVDAGRLWRAVEADVFQPLQNEVLEAPDQHVSL